MTDEIREQIIEALLPFTQRYPDLTYAMEKLAKVQDAEKMADAVIAVIRRAR